MIKKSKTWQRTVEEVAVSNSSFFPLYVKMKVMGLEKSLSFFSPVI